MKIKTKLAWVALAGLVVAGSAWASDYWIKVTNCNGCGVELYPSGVPTPTATATATATTTPSSTPTNTVTLTAPQSTLVQCVKQVTGNSNRLPMSPGTSAVIGCGTTGNTVDLAPNTTIMADCGGAASNNSWTPIQNAQTVKVICNGSGPTKTPTPTPSATTGTPTPAPTATPPLNLPAGWPAPPAIPPAPTLVSPTTISPGVMVGTIRINGDGVRDDTAGIQAALNSSDVLFLTGTYAIAGSVTIPTGRNIQCQPGATLKDLQAKSTVMLKIGMASNSLGKNSIVGCTLAGTDTAADHSTYQGGVSGYSELLEVASGWGIHTDNVLISGNTVQDAQGDGIITYSPCGTKNSGNACNGGAPGNEGPSNVFIVNTTVKHTAQPGIHVNGGQNVVVTGTRALDTVIAEEGDGNVLQVMRAWWYNNLVGNSGGWYNPQNGQYYGSYTSCTNNNLIPMNDSGCYYWNSTIDGKAPNGRTGQMWQQFGCGPAAGQGARGGNYSSITTTNGATIRTGC